MNVGHTRTAVTLSDYLRVLRRWWWIIGICAVALPAIAYYYYSQQPAKYTASTEVLVSNQNLPSSVVGAAGNRNSDPVRDLDTLARVAEVPRVAAGALNALNIKSMSLGELLAETTVTADPNADILTFSVTDPNGRLAVKLSNEYAKQFMSYRTQLQTAVIDNALAPLDARIAALRRALRGVAPPDQDPTVRQQLSVLLSKRQDLENLRSLQANNLVLVKPATGAPQTEPKVLRNSGLAALAGLFLGVALAFLANAIDNRARGADDVSTSVGLALLGRIPMPPRRFRKHRRLAMLSDKPGDYAEAYRKLRTNLDFANLTANAKSIMFTSSVEEEGKTTTACNLAVALAKAGRRVVLIDLDLRRPLVATVFGLEGRPGVTDTVLGSVNLDEALETPSLGGRSTRAAGISGPGSLQILTAGTRLPDPAEFVGTPALADLLTVLRERADVVLLDTPPLLPVSDAMTISAMVEAVVLIVRAGRLDRGMLSEAHRLLMSTPAVKLGFVLTNSQAEGKYGYGGHYGGYESTLPVAEKESLH